MNNLQSDEESLILLRMREKFQIIACRTGKRIMVRTKNKHTLLLMLIITKSKQQKNRRKN